jgi:subtilisin family serine protease
VRTRITAALTALLVTAPTVALAASSDDPRRSQMWWFDTIGVEAAWDTTQGEGIVIAVLDTGVEPTHPDLVDRFGPTRDGSTGIDLIDNDDDPSDPNGHGTIVAGLAVATANNGEGIAGVAPRATLLPVRVLDDDGRGQSSTVDAGIRWAVDHGADIVNLSLEVEEQESGGPNALLVAPNDAIEYAWSKGVIVIAASGNSGAGAAGYRIGSPVVLVGAVDKEDELAVFSDADRDDAVMAPGVQMVSTWCSPTPTGCNPDERYGEGAGTSFAAPIVAGVAALLRSAGLDHVQAVDVLRRSARDVGVAGPDPKFGVGIVDAGAAMATAIELLAAGGTPAPASTRSAATAGDTDPSNGDGQTSGVVANPGSPSVAPRVAPDEVPDEVSDVVPDGATDADAPSAPSAPRTVDAAAPGDTGDRAGRSGPLVLLATVLLAAASVLTAREARATSAFEHSLR